MATDHFCLKWNNFHSSLVSAFESLQSSEDLVDVTLMCEGRNVKAHKVILSACSPYFRNLFKETPCKHPIIILKDVLHCDLVAILQFMYQGEVLINQDGLTSFIKTAELLQVSGLAGNNSSNTTTTVNNQDASVLSTQNTASIPLPTLSPTTVFAASQLVSTSPLPASLSVASSGSIVPIRPVSSVSPKPVINKHKKDITVDNNHGETETISNDSIPQSAKHEIVIDPEPLQSCSYQTTEQVVIKTERPDEDFQEMDYTELEPENISNAGSGTEEQSILERSLKSQDIRAVHSREIEKIPKGVEYICCPNCSLITEKKNLSTHVCSNMNTASSVCSSCKEMVETTKLFTHECKRQKIQIQKCSDCNKIIGRTESLAAHKRSCTKKQKVNEPVTCPNCNKLIARARHLKAHIGSCVSNIKITKTSYEPINCPYCEKLISRAKDLKAHIGRCKLAPHNID